jgi:D-3-phosphoglycerate dehydrogenase
MGKFRVGIEGSFLNAAGQVSFGDIGLGILDADPLIEYEFFDATTPEVKPEQIAGYDGVIALGGLYTATTLAGNSRLAVIGRYGVGYDNVDTDACTGADVMLFITPDGVRRPVASSIMTLMLALSHRLMEKHLYSQQGRAAELQSVIGVGLEGKVLGSVGIGNIGRELFRLAAPFGMRHMAHDPFVSPADAAAIGVEMVTLDTLLKTADFLCINCPLMPSTRNLIGAPQLASMKPAAFLINTARGGIVDTRALTQALQARTIAGAGLDVTEPEPLPLGHPLLAMDNVIVTSHRLCWTDQCMLGNGSSDMEGMRRVARGQIPTHVVNRTVLEKPGLQAKLEGYRRMAGPVQG